MPRSICLIAAAVFTLVATQPGRSQDSQYDDARNPHYKAAQQDLDNNNATAAASEYEAALAANPELADAQFQLGMIYAEKLQDQVSSIYHFKHYLAVAPNGAHAANAKQMIDKEKRAFAETIPADPGGTDPATLKTENAELKKQAADAAQTIATLQADLARANAASAAATSAGAPQASAPTVAATTPAGPQKALPLDAPNPAITNAASADGTPAAPTGPSKSYTVTKGDSLWKIAHKMYPHDTLNGEDKIREANKEVFNGKFLQPGQVLVIPQ